MRFRVDGVLEPYRQLPTPALTGIISRFKVLCGMDIAEKRSPQDGRFTHRLGPTSQKVDIRVATLPTKHGERMTLRLLALQTESLTIERLGMSPRDLVHLRAGDRQAARHDPADRPDGQRQDHHAVRRPAAS